MPTAADPVLVTATFCAAVGVLTCCLPNLSSSADSFKLEVPAEPLAAAQNDTTKAVSSTRIDRPVLPEKLLWALINQQSGALKSRTSKKRGTLDRPALR